MILFFLSVAMLCYTPPPPDFDRDGDVDQSDWAIMQIALGEPHMPFSRCDMNMDGTVDQVDVMEFMRWQRKPMH